MRQGKYRHRPPLFRQSIYWWYDLGGGLHGPAAGSGAAQLYGAYLNPVEACADGFAAGYAVDQPPNNYGYWLHFYSNYYDANIGRCMAWVSGNVVNTSLAIGIPGIARRSACPMGTTVATEYWGDAVQYWVPTSCNASCPVHSTLSGSACTCDNPTASDPINYVPDSAGTSCVPAAICPVDPLPKSPPPFSDACSNSLEKGAGVDVDNACEAGLTPDMKKGASCLADKIHALAIPYTGPSATIRTEAYQNHLLAVWNKSEEIEKKVTDADAQACASVSCNKTRMQGA